MQYIGVFEIGTLDPVHKAHTESVFLPVQALVVCVAEKYLSHRHCLYTKQCECDVNKDFFLSFGFFLPAIVETKQRPIILSDEEKTDIFSIRNRIHSFLQKLGDNVYKFN